MRPSIHNDVVIKCDAKKQSDRGAADPAEIKERRFTSFLAFVVL